MEPFLDIYKQFNMRLEEQGLAYEGALYRKVVNDENIKFQHKKYLFVGFNMMQVVERKLCDRLMKEGKAHFYWDYDDYYMQTIMRQVTTFVNISNIILTN